MRKLILIAAIVFLPSFASATMQSSNISTSNLESIAEVSGAITVASSYSVQEFAPRTRIECAAIGMQLNLSRTAKSALSTYCKSLPKLLPLSSNTSGDRHRETVALVTDQQAVDIKSKQDSTGVK